MKINDAKTHAAIKIDGEMSTQAVEQLMRDLALLRGQMLPQVPVKIEESATNALTQSDADIAAWLSTDGEVRLAARHLGYGWLVFSFSSRRAGQIGQGLVRLAGGEVIDLITTDQAQGQKAH